MRVCVCVCSGNVCVVSVGSLSYKSVLFLFFFVCLFVCLFVVFLLLLILNMYYSCLILYTTVTYIIHWN